ncbi:MAG: hydrogenase expression/formation protein HypE [Desulfurococcaceae archaeon]
MSRITLAHGAGGLETRELLESILFKRVDEKLKKVIGGVGIDFPDDAAAIPMPGDKYLILSTDAYTVNPIFFPGGDIGVLAVAGSINDVLMFGGKPIALLDSIVVEEGFPLNDLERILDSMLRLISSENVALIGGDFKVMPRGQIDKIVITTTGVGIAERPILDRPQSGDKIIVSDYVGDHGAVIMLAQMGLDSTLNEFSSGLLKSDVKPLSNFMLPLLAKYGKYISAARDPTRGGLAGVLNEWAYNNSVLIHIKEEDVPIREPVRRYAEALGVDPLYLASEGVAVISIRADLAAEVLEFIHSQGFDNARIIGEVRKSDLFKGYVVAETSIGGLRLIEPPRGELVPRIC